MPEISRFPGLVVAMLYNDHAPPHFHVRYGEFSASLLVDPPSLLSGRLPPRVLGLVMERAASHREDLLADWERARTQQALVPIAPLEQAMQVNVVQAVPRGEWRLFLRVDGGSEGEVAIASVIPFSGVFERLRDPAFFARVEVDRDWGTVRWPGDLDLAPEPLYERITGRNPVDDRLPVGAAQTLVMPDRN